MSILNQIVENKKIELESTKSDKNFFKSKFKEKNASIIAEIKLASPSFDYSWKIDLDELFRFYGENEFIKAVSNLIDEKYFKWDIKRGYDFKKKYKKPIFFKEFVIDKRQIDGAYYFAYDAILLLQRVLNFDKLQEFIDYSNSKNILPVVEIDDEKWMEEILKLKNDFAIWINCRNLKTMEINRQRHFEIYEKFKAELEDKIVFAFSGIDDLKQVNEYVWKFNWVLIGTYFVGRI